MSKASEVEQQCAEQYMPRYGVHFIRTAWGCIEWIKNMNKKGYGAIGWAGTTVKAHRAMFIKRNGAIESGNEIHHVCFNPACIRRRHKVEVTPAEHRRLHRSAARMLARMGKRAAHIGEVYRECYRHALEARDVDVLRNPLRWIEQWTHSHGY